MRRIRGVLWIGLYAVAQFIINPLDVSAQESRRRPPNIVFILADDLGWTDLGCFGSRYYETPNIDRLCQQGMKFTQAYTNGPNCAPTRASLMSGQYTPRHGIYTVATGARGLEKFRKMIPAENQQNLPLEEVTIAAALKNSGYATAMFGKWHLGETAEYHPSRRGFDQALVSMGRHFNFRTNPPTNVDGDTYLADFLTDQSVRFIDQNKARPFFLYLPHFAVHVPHEAKKELISKYEKKQPAGGHHSPVYAAMIESLDQSVGRILDKLDELQLAGNTIVIFFSDNGGVGGYEAAGVPAKGITGNAPLRGGKGMLYDGGIRVPLIVRWSGNVQPGSVCDEPVIGLDFYPTFLELAGASAPPGHTLDGRSLSPLLQSAGKARLNREAMFWHFPGYLEAGADTGNWRTTPAGAVRSGNYKLVEFFEDGHVELYNLKEDVGETRDLARKMPEKASELHGKLKAWRQAIRAPMPTPNPAYQPVSVQDR
jgi:arylsulfatase A-like enzyme